MVLHLTDLDELTEKVRNRYVKEYAIESLNAYRSGAYRASVSITWVAVCIDIIEKIKELSNSGDKQAKVYHDKLNEIVKNDKTEGQANKMMTFENKLISIAEEFEFITPFEVEQLGRLKRDRNFAVHPTFQKDERHISISPESARNHIVNACNFLFIHPTTQGKILQEPLLAMIKSESFPMDDAKAAQNILYSEHWLGRARASLIKNIFVNLLGELLLGKDGVDTKTSKRLCNALNTSFTMSYKIGHETLKDSLPPLLAKLKDHGIKRLFILVSECQFIKRYLDKGTEERLKQIIKSLSGQEIVDLSITKLADENDSIKKELLVRFSSLEEVDKKYILEKSISNSLKGFAIERFINSPSFQCSYDNGNNILLNYAKLFDTKDIQKILEGVFTNKPHSINQVINAGGIKEVFKKLWDVTSNYSTANEELWEGFLAKIEEGYPDLERDLRKHIEDNYITPF